LTSPTAEFFNALGSIGHEPMLQKTTGTVRFEVSNGKRTERWLVSIDKGDVAVSHAKGPADCTVRGPKELIDKIVSGEVNAMAAVLRGAIDVEGDTLLVVLIQRVFPAPAKGARS
jgi:putative sterol carrier protein